MGSTGVVKVRPNTDERSDIAVTEEAVYLGSFHDVGKLFRGEITVGSIEPGTTVEQVLKIMLEHRYSQLPVVEDGEVHDR